MSPDLVSVIPEVNELADFIGRVRLMSGEHSNHGVRSDTIERIRVAGDHTFQCMAFHDGLFELLLIFRLAGHGRLRNDDSRPRSRRQGVKQMLHERQLVL